MRANVRVVDAAGDNAFGEALEMPVTPIAFAGTQHVAARRSARLVGAGAHAARPLSFDDKLASARHEARLVNAAVCHAERRQACDDSRVDWRRRAQTQARYAGGRRWQTE